MKRWIITAFAVTALALVGLVGAFAIAPGALAAAWHGGDAGARDGTGPIVGAAYGPGQAVGPRNGVGPIYDANGIGMGPQYSLVAVAADQLNMSRTDLVAELQAGKTVAQVAAEKKVDTSKIVDAFIALRAELLNQRVADGQFTQAQVDAMLVAMRAHVTTQLNEPWTGWARGAGIASGIGAGPMYER